MAYKGKWQPKNRNKYNGDYTKITFRSLWERNTFRWMDDNPNVISWSSEEVVVPYICGTDKKMHRYFVDIWFKDKSGKAFLVEIKPKKETTPPKKPANRRTKRYINESLTYIKNASKWKAAEDYCADRGWVFQIWHEDHLKALGIRILK